MKVQTILDRIEAAKDKILQAERHIWKNPETGFREWKTHAYLKEQFEALGYVLTEAGDIPGFYTDLDTGREGPCLAVFGEMDGLLIPSHPESDPETGAVHACGHHCQCAALLGLAIALKEEGATDGLCGKIRLIAVPAEEGIEMEYRRELRQKGILRYLSGKLEFLARGYLDGVDLAMMIHTGGGQKFGCIATSNGNVVKKAVFRGKSAHAGGAPHAGHNALYAATNAMSLANAMRETFREQDHIRFHPIVTAGGSSVNAIPDQVVVESYVRGASTEAIRLASEKVNLAFAGAAAAMHCSVEFFDEHNYTPRKNDPVMREVFYEVGKMLFPEERLSFTNAHSGGCSDMGDINAVMPSVHPHLGGAKGDAHSDQYTIVDPYLACVVSAKLQYLATHKLLCDNAAEARRAIAQFERRYPTKEDFFAELEKLTFHGQGVEYREDGSVLLHYHA